TARAEERPQRVGGLPAAVPGRSTPIGDSNRGCARRTLPSSNLRRSRASHTYTTTPARALNPLVPSPVQDQMTRLGPPALGLLAALTRRHRPARRSEGLAAMTWEVESCRCSTSGWHPLR